MRAFLRDSREMLIVVALWGVFFLSGKLATAEAAPFAVSTLRFALASAILVPMLAVREPRRLRPTGPELALGLGLAATGVALYNLFALEGLTRAPSTDGAMISPCVNPVFTMLVASAWLGEKMTRTKWLALALAAPGMALIFWEPLTAAQAAPGRWIGDLLFLGAGLMLGSNALLGRWGGGRLTPLSSATYASFLGLLMLLPWGLPALRGLDWARPSWGFWAQIVFLAVGCTVIAFFQWYAALNRIGAARASSWLFMVPIIGVVAGSLRLGEVPSPLQGLGMALATAAVWLANKPGAAPAPISSPEPPQ